MAAVPKGTVRWWVIRSAIEVVYWFEWLVFYVRFWLCCCSYYIALVQMGFLWAGMASPDAVKKA